MTWRHSPGPWTPGYSERRGVLCVTSPTTWVCGELFNGDARDIGREEAKANAALIAAAPDYADAAEKIIRAFGDAPDEVIAGAFGSEMLVALNGLRGARVKALTAVVP